MNDYVDYAIVNKKPLHIPGLRIRHYEGEAALQRWGYPRGGYRVDKIGLHNIRGDWPEVLTEESRDTQTDEAIARMFDEDDRSGTHFIIDGDGSIVQVADPGTRLCYHIHAPAWNRTSIGIEWAKYADGAITVPSLEAGNKLCQALCISFWIPMTIAAYDGVFNREVAEDDPHFAGLGPHCLVTNKRGKGDCGLIIPRYLVKNGPFEVLDVRVDSTGESEYTRIYKKRQTEVGVHPDGWPGIAFRNACKAAGYQHGIYQLGKGDELSNKGTVVPDFGELRDVMCELLCGK